MIEPARQELHAVLSNVGPYERTPVTMVSGTSITRWASPGAIAGHAESTNYGRTNVRPRDAFYPLQPLTPLLVRYPIEYAPVPR